MKVQAAPSRQWRSCGGGEHSGRWSPGGALGSAWRAGRAAQGHTRAERVCFPAVFLDPLVSGGSRCMVVGQVEWAGLPGSSILLSGL